MYGNSQRADQYRFPPDELKFQKRTLPGYLEITQEQFNRYSGGCVDLEKMRNCRSGNEIEIAYKCRDTFLGLRECIVANAKKQGVDVVIPDKRFD